MSARIFLRSLRESDLERICRWLRQKEVAEGLVLKKKITLREERTWFQKYRKDRTKKVFAIEHAERHIGNISLFNIDDHHRRAMMSVFIGEERFRGKGFGNEAVREILQYAFQELGLQRISAEVLRKNLAAIRCYQKAGMKREGILRSHVVLNHQRKDMILLSILAKDYLRRVCGYGRR